MNEAISQMLVTFRTFETEVLPNNFNPLSISVKSSWKSSWKKRKILDLRFVRVCHLRFLRVKFEDLKVALNY